MKMKCIFKLSFRIFEKEFYLPKEKEEIIIFEKVVSTRLLTDIKIIFIKKNIFKNLTFGL